EPDAQIGIDQPPAEPALDQDAAAARGLHLHRVQLSVDRGVLLRHLRQLGQTESPPAGLLAEDFTARQIPQAEGLGEPSGPRALAGPDLSADRDDHWSSTAASAASSSSWTISLLVKRCATVSGCTAESTT